MRFPMRCSQTKFSTVRLKLICLPYMLAHHYRSRPLEGCTGSGRAGEVEDERADTRRRGRPEGGSAAIHARNNVRAGAKLAGLLRTHANARPRNLHGVTAPDLGLFYDDIDQAVRRVSTRWVLNCARKFLRGGRGRRRGPRLRSGDRRLSRVLVLRGGGRLLLLRVRRPRHGWLSSIAKRAAIPNGCGRGGGT